MTKTNGSLSARVRLHNNIHRFADKHKQGQLEAIALFGEIFLENEPDKSATDVVVYDSDLYKTIIMIANIVSINGTGEFSLSRI